MPEYATPLVMDWPSHERTNLEEALAQDGLVLVTVAPKRNKKRVAEVMSQIGRLRSAGLVE